MPTYRMTTEQAIEIVARHIAADELKYLGEDTLWEDFPEIGEFDWLAVLEHAATLVEKPTAEQYDEAYALLTARAEEI